MVGPGAEDEGEDEPAEDLHGPRLGRVELGVVLVQERGVQSRSSPVKRMPSLGILEWGERSFPAERLDRGRGGGPKHQDEGRRHGDHQGQSSAEEKVDRGDIDPVGEPLERFL